VHLIQKGQGHFSECELNRSYSVQLKGRPQRLNEGSVHMISCRCALLRDTDANGTQDSQKGCFCFFSAPTQVVIVFVKDVMLGMLTTILCYLSSSLTFVPCLKVS